MNGKPLFRIDSLRCWQKTKGVEKDPKKTKFLKSKGIAPEKEEVLP